jgi:hypothetical protein
VADIIELILADHQRVRRLEIGLRDAARRCGAEPSWVLPHVWDRLADLIEEHTAAEEEICWLTMFGAGPTAAARVRQMTATGEDIREAIAESRLQPAGSACWWMAVNHALRNWTVQAGHEETVILTGFACRSDQSLRDRLARQWLAFGASHGPGSLSASTLARRTSRMPGLSIVLRGS